MKYVRTAAYYLAFGALIPLLLIEVAFQLLPVASPPFLEPVTARDPVPHFQPGVDYRYAAGPDFAIRSRKHSNNYGYNHVSDYRPADATPLLALVGDSFVEAHEVDAGKSAAEILHAGLAGQGRVYSFGISGAQLPTYMMFAESARDKFRPNALAVVIIANDFDESLLKYKDEPRLHYFTDAGEVRRIDYEISPLRRLLRASAFARYAQHHLLLGHRLDRLKRRFAGTVDPDPEAERLKRLADSKKAVDFFLDQLPGRAGLPPGSIALVLDADRPAIYDEAALRLSAGSYFAQMRDYTAEQALARGYQVIDLQPAFIARYRRTGARFEFPADKHWNELGQQVVAAEIRNSALFSRVFGGAAVTKTAAPRQ